MCMCLCYASRRRDTSCELVTGVKKCALPISKENTILASARRYAERGGHPRLPDTELTHCWLKKHRYAIHAIALARRFRPVIEHMPQMPAAPAAMDRSEEHTSELQSLMSISYAVFCLTKKQTPPHYKLPCRTVTHTLIDRAYHQHT